MKHSLHSAIALALTMIALTACNNKSFKISGTITNAADSTLYLENASLDGPVVVDSVTLNADGSFSFSDDAPDAPEFYRLRIAGQIINVAIDSTEAITIKAAYPTMAASYEIEGSDDNKKIRELTLKQLALQQRIDDITQSPDLGVEAVSDSVQKVVAIYREDVRANYIYKEPMRAYAYFALFQTYRLGYYENLIFNPRQSKDDVKTYAAVATSWDTYHPNALRGTNLHNIALEGMKNQRIVQNQQQQAIEASKINQTGMLEIALNDNNGSVRRLSDLKGKVVLLDFHLFGIDGSTKRIMQMRELYNKYHSRGLEIYQVSLDSDEHFWKTQVASLPWINVRDAAGASASKYNVQQAPTFFLLNRDNAIYKRDAQISNLEAEIESLL